MAEVRPTATSLPTWRYMKYQPFLMAFFFICTEKVRDPMYFWPFQLVTTSIAFYLMAGISAPVWMLIRMEIERNAFLQKPLRDPAQWLRLTLGAVPLLVLPLLMTIGEEGFRGVAAHPMEVCTLIGCAILASMTGTLHYLNVYAPRQGDDARSDGPILKRFRGMFLWLIIAGILALTLIIAHVLLHTPDLPWNRRLLAKAIPVSVAVKAKNVYVFKLRGYFLASGDPDLYHFRFDADPDTVKELIRAVQAEDKFGLMRSENVAPSGPDWWTRGQLDYYGYSKLRFWVDASRNRVFFEVYDRDE